MKGSIAYSVLRGFPHGSEYDERALRWKGALNVNAAWPQRIEQGARHRYDRGNWVALW